MRGRQIYGQQVSEKDKHISSVCACQISSRKWVSLSLTGPHRFLSVIPGYFHLSDAPRVLNLRMFTSCYGEKQSGEQKEESDSERWRSWQVAVCVSAECGCRAKQRGKISLLTRAEVLQFADLFLNSQEKEVLQNFLQLLLGVQAETLQVVIPQSEQRTAWRKQVHGQEARLIVTPEASSAFLKGRCMTCT